ncbi:PREDICTED: uncharacterized protein LOC109116423 isoform X2 [Tarenaya hassleriana]|uniref:uncharacterized protein LOC109116423 isoform X2 n=1 Tax=Tarenaya hassleriana TaxID=28532 RepID=UPI0008FD6EE2|nr:PREDICTED: uncharacterized protein LOC109116423 isoform X2 [Tarenaya hassleriana]
MSGQGVVELRIQEKHVVMDNGILQVTISKPDGMITGICYNGIKNLLETHNEESHRGLLHGLTRERLIQTRSGYWGLLRSRSRRTRNAGSSSARSDSATRSTPGT